MSKKNHHRHHGNDHDHHRDHDCRRGSSIPGYCSCSSTNLACTTGATSTTTTTAPAPALRLNHDGVELLMSGGKDDEAIAILKRGLVCMKSEISSGASFVPHHDSITSATNRSISFAASSSLSSSTTTTSSYFLFSPATGDVVTPPQQEQPHVELPSSYSVSNPPSTPRQRHFFPRMVAVPVYQESRTSKDAFFVYPNAFTFIKMQPTMLIAMEQDENNNHIDEHQYILVQQEQAEHGKSFSARQIITSDILSATIIYNLALVYHLKAIQGPPNRGKGSTTSRSNNRETRTHSSNAARRRALVLYDMCIKILKSIIDPAAAARRLTSSFLSYPPDQEELHAEGSTASDFPTTIASIPRPALCIAVACCNNMAHLVYIQQDFNQWREVLETLQWFLCIYESESAKEDGDFVTPFLESDVEGFKWNSILVQLPITANAA